MTWTDAGIVVASAILGGSGIVGITVHIIKRYIDKKLDAAEKQAEERDAYRIKKAACQDRMQRAESRWIFWVNRWIETGSHNGELAQAFEEYQAAEREKKELEREIITKFEQRKS